MDMLGKFLKKTTDEIANDASKLVLTKVEDFAKQANKNIVNSASEFVSSSLQNFGIADTVTKIQEGAGKVLSSIGELTGFKSLTKGVETKEIENELARITGNSQIFSNNLPAQAQVSAARENIDDVIITLESTISSDIVKFVATPRISESRSASYNEINVTHHPGSILKYEKTNSRTWSLSARLISRTPEEASENQRILNTIRAWVMPYYGSGTAQNDKEKLGAPPEVLRFSGYGKKNISPIPVVLESYDTSWPNDIDYIPTIIGDPFPVIMEINLTIKESYSPSEYSGFNLFAYKSGDLSLAFSGQKFVNTQISAPVTKTAVENADTSQATKIQDPVSKATGLPTANDLINVASDFAKQAANDFTKQVKTQINGKITSTIKNVIKL